MMTMYHVWLSHSYTMVAGPHICQIFTDNTLDTYHLINYIVPPRAIHYQVVQHLHCLHISIIYLCNEGRNVKVHATMSRGTGNAVTQLITHHDASQCMSTIYTHRNTFCPSSSPSGPPPIHVSSCIMVMWGGHGLSGRSFVYSMDIQDGHLGVLTP